MSFVSNISDRRPSSSTIKSPNPTTAPLSGAIEVIRSRKGSLEESPPVAPDRVRVVSPPKEASLDKRSRLDDGVSKIDFPNGSSLEVRCVGGKPESKGRITFPNGDVYIGEFLNGKLEGQGEYFRPNGEIYKGGFLNDKFHGAGEYRYKNGTIYKGDFLNGKHHGKGIYSMKNGEVYEGDFVEGLCTGRGVLTRPGGYRYEGGFVDDKFTGQGVLARCGDLYEGFFKNGFASGLGKLTGADGTYFSGQFVNDEPITNMSHLGELHFLRSLVGTDTIGDSPGYPLGILIDYLNQNSFSEVAEALDSVRKRCLLDPSDCEAESEKIYNRLLKEGAPELFAYGFDLHTMGLELSKSPDSNEFIECRIFNSGGGLTPYHVQKGKKYQTMLHIRVPISSISPEFIEGILRYESLETVKESYKKILDLEGAQIEVVPAENAVWQTQQKGENCALEWIFAYLKNTLSLEDYIRMRIKLFELCLEVADPSKASASFDCTAEIESIKQKLKQKIAKRKALQPISRPPGVDGPKIWKSPTEFYNLLKTR